MMLVYKYGHETRFYIILKMGEKTSINVEKIVDEYGLSQITRQNLVEKKPILK